MPDEGTADLRTAFDHAPIGIAMLTPTGVVTVGNAALGELFQRSPDELLARPSSRSPTPTTCRRRGAAAS